MQRSLYLQTKERVELFLLTPKCFTWTSLTCATPVSTTCYAMSNTLFANSYNCNMPLPLRWRNSRDDAIICSVRSGYGASQTYRWDTRSGQGSLADLTPWPRHVRTNSRSRSVWRRTDGGRNRITGYATVTRWRWRNILVMTSIISITYLHVNILYSIKSDFTYKLRKISY